MPDILPGGAMEKVTWIPQGQIIPHWLLMRDARILPLARFLFYRVAKTPEEYLGMIYDIVANKIKYIPDKKEFGMEEYVQMPFETIINGAGDCEDKSIAFVSLANAIGIPAREGLGYVYQGGKRISHRWGEALYNGEWHLFETTNSKVGHFPIDHYREMGYEPMFYIAPNYLLSNNLLILPQIYP